MPDDVNLFAVTRSWTRDNFTISTDPSLVPIAELTQAFASEQLYWAKALPEPAMRQMLDNSLNFGLYTTAPTPDTTTTTTPTGNETSLSPQPQQQQQQLIGFARCITDHTTFLYLTDVYVLPAWQGRGLGRWLLGCVQQVVDAMPHLRRSMLLAGHRGGDARRLYGDVMRMAELGGGAAVLSWRGPGCSF